MVGLPIAANIAVVVNGVKRGFVLESIDLDEKRDALALSIGREIVDSIWQEVEGK